MAMLEMRLLNQFSTSERNKNLNTLSVQTTSHSAFGRTGTTVSGASGKASVSTAAHSHASSGTHRKHRSRSTTRCEEKPKKKKHHLGSGSTSLVSIPNAIKLSMLNSGLMSFGEFFSVLFF
ncbi:UNVERIFIED_CONTAM: hypothetical protein PYX00_000268 [Menopon gallinae]|uniref:Uncharacterized protein n=1 Tax=Menopon gallinae TaxID=328185 RepID=A0AAW2I9V0_9NEOP